MNHQQTEQGNRYSAHRPEQPTGRRCMHGLLAIVVALSASVLDIGAANGQACITPPPNMVAWWPLDELAGPTAAEIVNNNDGTHINGPAPLAGAFVLNSLCFDGLSNYVEVPNAPDLNFGTGDLSVDAWVQTTTTGGVKVIVEHRENVVDAAGNPTGVVGYSMYLYQGRLHFQLADGNGSNLCACLATAACTNYGAGVPGFVADGAWHHVAVTVNRTSITGGTFYVDGVAVASFNPTCQPGSLTNNGVLRIGSLTLGAGGASLFNGCIDEVELFNRELSANEVAALFFAGPAGKCKTPPPETKLSKWTQLPHPPGEGFDAPSNLWWNKTPVTGGQRVLADDFPSRCKPGATCCETCFVTWKGSYVDPNFPIGIIPIDGFLISFFTDQPATPVDPSRPKDLIVTYFVDQFEEIQSTACPPGCDGHPVFDYNADLRNACIINNPMGIAAQNQCLPMPTIDTIWWISIEPVLGFIYTKDPANPCVQIKTNSSWPNDFWGWHTTPPQFNFNDDAFLGTLSISPAPKVFTYNWLQDLHWFDVASSACQPDAPNLSVNLAFDLHDNFGSSCWDQPACILPPIDPSSLGVDVPTGYQWSGGDVGGQTKANVVVADDFISDGRPITGVRWWGSYLDPTYIPEACCFADGTCLYLSPSQCAALGGLSLGPNSACLGDANANGVDDACEQIDPQCGPDPLAPIRCLPMTCPVAGEECLPTCVLVETDTGILLEVLDCKCMSPNDCHVDILSGPVPTCVGTCPTPSVCISVLTDQGDGTSILCCQCVIIDPQCGPDPVDPLACAPVICPPGEECLPTCVLVETTPDGTIGNLISVLDCKCMSPNECHVDITPGLPPSCIGTCPLPAQCTTTLVDNGDGTSTLCCLCNPPPECGPDPTTDPPDTRCLPFTCLNAGEECLPVCAIFDPVTGFTTVLECTCMNPNDCHLVIVQGTVPQCAGTCPANAVCTTTQIVNADGTIIFCCECRPPPQCGLDPLNPLACAQTVCPTPGEECLPTCVLVETGTGILLSVLNCQCMSPNACHIEINAGIPPKCVGSCPAPGQCVTRLTDNGDGTSTLCCECVPPIVCGPDATGQGCLPVTCPIPGQECSPICAIFDPATGISTVISCNCVDPNSCFLIIPVGGGLPTCSNGGCPQPGDACALSQTQNPDGTITFCCGCGLPANASADGAAPAHFHRFDAAPTAAPDEAQGVVSARTSFAAMQAYHAAHPIAEATIVPFNESPGPQDAGPDIATEAAGDRLDRLGPNVQMVLDGGEGVEPPSASAPALINSFAGTLDDNTFIPPDTMGAAGPNHLVVFLNSGFTVYSKAGALVAAQVTLQSFWSSLGTAAGQPASSPFDPKILFDQYSDCWVVTADGNPNCRDGTQRSWVLVGVSATNDPTGAWYLYAIQADVGNDVGLWADYPGLGVDPNNVVVTNNMFLANCASNPPFRHADVWVFDKAKMKSLMGLSPLTLASDYSLHHNPCGTNGFTFQPCHTFGQTAVTAVNYLVDQGWVDVATRARRFLRVKSITGTGAAATINCAGGNDWVEVTGYNFELLDAPQLSCVDIETNDTRMLDAVVRDGNIFCTHHVGAGVPADTTPPPPATKTEVAWYEIDPTTAPGVFPGGVPNQQGRVVDSTLFYYFPSIAVNQFGCIALGFSGSGVSPLGAGTPASAYYTMHNPATEAAGVMQPVGLLKAGEAPYFKQFGGTRNRWGDYSATCIDPVDDTTFWTIQEYASLEFAPGNCQTDTGRWGTWWGSFTCASVQTGACCDTATGVCTDGVPQTACQGATETWYPGQTCATINCGITGVEGWFISFHYGDPAGVTTCPPDFLSGVAPTVTGLYFCPASAVRIVDTGMLDCFQERVFQYDVQLKDCCLICTLPDPRRPNIFPAQPDAFHEVRDFDYWLDIQAVVGATFDPLAGANFCQKVITNTVPSNQPPAGDFWGWHTSPAVTQPQGPLNEACVGAVFNLPPAPPFCPDYGAWAKQPWLCPPPVNRVDMAFELLTLCTCLGDMDGNTVLNGLDIQDFVDCLIGTAGPGVNCVCADMDSSGTLDMADVGLFISALLTKAPCP